MTKEITKERFDTYDRVVQEIIELMQNNEFTYSESLRVLEYARGAINMKMEDSKI